MSKTIQRRARKGRAAWKFDSIWPDKDAELAMERLKKKNPQFEFRFAKPKRTDPFSGEEHRPEEVD